MSFWDLFRKKPLYSGAPKKEFRPIEFVHIKGRFSTTMIRADATEEEVARATEDHKNRQIKAEEEEQARIKLAFDLRTRVLLDGEMAQVMEMGHALFMGITYLTPMLFSFFLRLLFLDGFQC